ncbi:Basic proline-rich protein precursor [Archangium gephyra]|uniref:Basic proline-rich protein n=1 Tax=Archangium gephyra TaxID=48 RepID=A0AAC8QEW7_9BACT|nr:Basic proline-rich protein precursor [Archangium gephyra]
MPFALGRRPRRRGHVEAGLPGVRVGPDTCPIGAGRDPQGVRLGNHGDVGTVGREEPAQGAQLSPGGPVPTHDGPPIPNGPEVGRARPTERPHGPQRGVALRQVRIGLLEARPGAAVPVIDEFVPDARARLAADEDPGIIRASHPEVRVGAEGAGAGRRLRDGRLEPRSVLPEEGHGRVVTEGHPPLGAPFPHVLGGLGGAHRGRSGLAHTARGSAAQQPDALGADPHVVGREDRHLHQFRRGASGHQRPRAAVPTQQAPLPARGPHLPGGNALDGEQVHGGPGCRDGRPARAIEMQNRPRVAHGPDVGRTRAPDASERARGGRGLPRPVVLLPVQHRTGLSHHPGALGGVRPDSMEIVALGLMTHPAPAIAAQAGAGGGDRGRQREGVELLGRGACGGFFDGGRGRLFPLAAVGPDEEERKRRAR